MRGGSKSRESRLSAAPRTAAAAVTLWVALPPALLGGCAVGPNYHSPPAPKTQGYTPDPLPGATEATAVGGGEAQRFAFGSDLPGQWWTLFGSAELDALIPHALQRY